MKVTVEAAGPADRLIGNLDLRSVPPMSEPQLLALMSEPANAGETVNGCARASALHVHRRGFVL